MSPLPGVRQPKKKRLRKKDITKTEAGGDQGGMATETNNDCSLWESYFRNAR